MLEGHLELTAVKRALGERVRARESTAQRLAQIDLAATPAPPVQVDQAVAGDSEDPGAEGQPPKVVLVDRLDHLEHHVGSQIFSGLDVSHLEEAVIVDFRVVSLVESLDRGAFKRLRALDEVPFS